MPHPERRENIERMLAKTPNDPFLLYALAMTFVAEGREEEAITHLTALAEAHPDYHAAYFQLGQVLGGRGETDDARNWLDRGAAIAARIGDRKAAGEMESFRDAL